MTAILSFFAGPIGRWLVVLALLVSFGGFCFLKGDEHRGRVDSADLQKIKNDWQAEKNALQKSVQDQQEKNLDLQRQAEEKYLVVTQGQDHYFTQTIKEIEHAPIASCPLPDPIRVRINAATDCASGESETACQLGKQAVPSP